jgi:hypothetical protein
MEHTLILSLVFDHNIAYYEYASIPKPKNIFIQNTLVVHILGKEYNLYFSSLGANLRRAFEKNIPACVCAQAVCQIRASAWRRTEELPLQSCDLVWCFCDSVDWQCFLKQMENIVLPSYTYSSATADLVSYHAGPNVCLIFHSLNHYTIISQQHKASKL